MLKQGSSKYMQPGHILVIPPSQSAVTSMGRTEGRSCKMRERCHTTVAEEATIITLIQMQTMSRGFTHGTSVFQTGKTSCPVSTAREGPSGVIINKMLFTLYCHSVPFIL